MLIYNIENICVNHVHTVKTLIHSRSPFSENSETFVSEYFIILKKCFLVTSCDVCIRSNVQRSSNAQKYNPVLVVQQCTVNLKVDCSKTNYESTYYKLTRILLNVCHYLCWSCYNLDVVIWKCISTMQQTQRHILTWNHENI